MVTGWACKGFWELLNKRRGCQEKGAWKAMQAWCCYETPQKCRKRLSSPGLCHLVGRGKLPRHSRAWVGADNITISLWMREKCGKL